MVACAAGVIAAFGVGGAVMFGGVVSVKTTVSLFKNGKW